jgi:cobalt-zinc-cadmium efflux system outer membrane protein
LTAVLVAGPTPAYAQGLLTVVDDVLAITSKAQSKKEQLRAHRHLLAPGAESALPSSPGSDAPRLGERVFVPPLPGVISGATAPPGRRYAGAAAAHIAPPARLPAQKVPLYGPLELPAREDEGPSTGLTLDAAIDRLVHTNYDLLTKFQELPKAQADVLSAGLRLNPLIFASADNLPYGSYSPQRPGASSYEATVAQPIDVNQKRKYRIRLAEQAKQVLEAQYQDAVRLEIDNLYTAFVNVLEARQAHRAAEVGRRGLAEVLQTTRQLVQKGQLPRTEVDRALIQNYNAEVAVRAAETAYRQAKWNLATLLAIPPEQADGLEVRGTIRDTAPPLPCVEDLIQIALQVRPDLAAYRLGVERAEAAVRLAKAERFEDLFLFYTPYNFTNNTPMGGKNASSWSLGVLLPLPIFNRNQGNIARAQTNATQTQIELSGQERQVANEVQRALAEYETSRGTVRQYERDILPAARRLREQKYRLFTKGQEGLVAYLEALRDYNEVVRQYLEALVRHRRDALRLNTVVGQRVTP